MREETLKTRNLLLAATLLTLAAPLATTGAKAEDIPVKLGVLNDMSGLYADISGPGSVVAAQMAADDFMAKNKGIKVEVVGADHQNKPDVGSAIARKWYDQENVDVIMDTTTSSVALAVTDVTREKNRIFLVSGGGTSDLTGAKCSPNTVQWTYDTWALANGTGSALTKQGGTPWFFITADYAFGAALERDAAAAVKKAGGTVAGSVKHPLSATDFSSFLLQGQASGAKVIGFANAGSDLINAIKQASEFGITQGGQSLAGLLIFSSDVKALGLQAALGPAADRSLLLGPERRHPRLLQALRREVQRQDAHQRPGRRLFQRHALSERSKGHQHQGRPQGDGADARHPHRRSAVRQGRSAHRRPRHPPHVPVQGEEAGGLEGSVGPL